MASSVNISPSEPFAFPPAACALADPFSVEIKLRLSPDEYKKKIVCVCACKQLAQCIGICMRMHVCVQEKCVCVCVCM